MGVDSWYYQNPSPKTSASSPLAKAASSVAGKAATSKTAPVSKAVAATPAKKVATTATAPIAKTAAKVAAKVIDPYASTPPTKRTVKTTTVKPSTSDPVGVGPSLGMLYDLIGTPATNEHFLPAVPLTRDTMWFTSSAPGSVAASTARPAGGLNSDKFYKRVAANGGQAPFEGLVDWAGIYDYLQEPARRRMEREREPVDITVHGGNRVNTGWADARDRVFAPRLPSEEILTAGPAPYTADPSFAASDRTGPTGGIAYVPSVEPPAAVAAIDSATIGLPRRDPRGYDSVFMTDGQVTTPDGTVIRPGVPARGLDATVAPKEPSTWDDVVDNTGKLLSNTGLGAVVSTLFPDIWNGIGGAFKGTGEPAGPVRDMPNWDADRGTWKGNDLEKRSTGPRRSTPIPPPFPDLNHNGIDDRIEGYTGPDTSLPPVDPTPNLRRVAFPDMPPYDPGVDDEWRYFYADGGPVEAPEEGYDRAAMQSDPRMALIADAEDAIENYAEGEPQPSDEAALRRFVKAFGDAALKELALSVQQGMKMRDRRTGRLIEGPGGPKDDAVPAVVVDKAGGKRPAALSDGEFVFSVDAVEGAGGPEKLQMLSDMLASRAG